MASSGVSSPPLLSRSPALDAVPDRAHDDKLRVVTAQTAAGLGWTTVALGVGFALKLVMARAMAAEAMGVVLAAQSFVALALVLAALGVPDAVVRYVGRDEDGRSAPRRTVFRALTIVAPVTLLTAIAALAGFWIWFARRMPADAMWATAIVIVTLPLLGIGDVLGAAFRGINRLATKLVLTDVARPAFVLVMLLLSPIALTQHASYVAGLYATGAAISAALLWALFARDDRWTDTGGSTARDLLQFGMPIAGSALIAGPVVNSIIPLMLTAWPGSAAVALFAIALSLQGIVALPVAALEQAAVPTWSRMVAHDTAGELGASYKRCATMGFTLAASGSLVLLANDRALLTSMFGPTFGAARGALQWTVVATLWGAFTGPNEGMLRALGRAGSIFRARTAAAVAGVVAGALLIPPYGLAGAVAAFVVVALLINSLYAVTLYKTSRIHWWSKPHAMVTVIVLAGLADVLWLREVWPVGAWIIAHVLALLVVVMNADVRSIVRGFLKSGDARARSVTERPYRLAVVTSHPVQYQAPLFQRLAAEGDIDLHVFYGHDGSIVGEIDRDFGLRVAWDRPLLDGYRSVVLRRSAERRGSWGRLAAEACIIGHLRRERFDAVLIHSYATRLSLLAYVGALASRTPVLLRTESHQLQRRRLWVDAAKQVALHVLLAMTRAVLVIGEANRRFFDAYGVPRTRQFFVPYSVDNEYFAEQAGLARPARDRLRRRHGWPEHVFVVGFSGKLIPLKRVADVIDAIGALQAEGWPIGLMVIGDGRERSSLEARVHTRGIRWTAFAGFQNQSELGRCYVCLDALVLSSESETWGLVLNEAMTFGLPVVASRMVGGSLDLIEEGGNGYTYPVGDVAALTDALRRLAASSDMRRQFGRRSCDIVQRYSYDACVHGILAALADVTVGRRPEAFDAAR